MSSISEQTPPPVSVIYYRRDQKIPVENKITSTIPAVQIDGHKFCELSNSLTKSSEFIYSMVYRKIKKVYRSLSSDLQNQLLYELETKARHYTLPSTEHTGNLKDMDRNISCLLRKTINVFGIVMTNPYATKSITIREFCEKNLNISNPNIQEIDTDTNTSNMKKLSFKNTDIGNIDLKKVIYEPYMRIYASMRTYMSHVVTQSNEQNTIDRKAISQTFKLIEPLHATIVSYFKQPPTFSPSSNQTNIMLDSQLKTPLLLEEKANGTEESYLTFGNTKNQYIINKTELQQSVISLLKSDGEYISRKPGTPTIELFAPLFKKTEDTYSPTKQKEHLNLCLQEKSAARKIAESLSTSNTSATKSGAGEEKANGPEGS